MADDQPLQEEPLEQVRLLARLVKNLVERVAALEEAMLGITGRVDDGSKSDLELRNLLQSNLPRIRSIEKKVDLVLEALTDKVLKEPLALPPLPTEDPGH